MESPRLGAILLFLFKFRFFKSWILTRLTLKQQKLLLNSDIWDIKKGEFEAFLTMSINMNRAEKCLSLIHALPLNTDCMLEKHLQLLFNLKVICWKTNDFVLVRNNQELKIYLKLFCAGLNTDDVFSKTQKCMLCLLPT